jgi:hypothetical protein
MRALASAVVECTKISVGGVRVEQIDDELTGELAIGKQGAGTRVLLPEKQGIKQLPRVEAGATFTVRRRSDVRNYGRT